jgi:3-deoxy-D-manno-octulosonate 8-phosphate phosphatase (KDO 8-P phosphatase)
MPARLTKSLRARLARIKLFLCDVDGILTDASIYIGLDREIKRFHIRDGLGLMMLRKQGIKVGWVSNRPSLATTLRAEELRIDFLSQNDSSKVQAVEGILAKTGFNWTEVCYLGDDVVDLGVLKRAGFAATVADGVAEARAMAHYVTDAPGGHGGVREVVELILKAQDRWDKIVAEASA